MGTGSQRVEGAWRPVSLYGLVSHPVLASPVPHALDDPWPARIRRGSRPTGPVERVLRVSLPCEASRLDGLRHLVPRGAVRGEDPAGGRRTTGRPGDPCL